MKQTILSEKERSGAGIRPLAWLLLLVFSFEVFCPARVYAGGGGPTQPEVHGFTPIGMNDMVDPFTGDFSYSIPLMDVEGYPINISYSSGISMDQEASWVGLGWNLNVGTVVRSMRGLPDDFNGDEVQHTTSMKPNRTIGVEGELGAEIFGKELFNGEFGDQASLSVSLGLSYNNYNGFATDFSFGPSFKFGEACSGGLTAGFQLSGSSENGASFSPSVSFEREMDLKKDYDIHTTGTIGSALNSRAGLSYISYGVSMKREVTEDEAVKRSHGYVRGGSDGAYNLGVASYSPKTGPSMANVSLSGSVTLDPFTIFGADAHANIGVDYSSQWIPEDQITIETPSYGYFHLQNGQFDEKGQLDYNRDDDAPFTKYTPNLPTAFLTYDIFSIQAQGASGNYRGFRNEVGYVFDPKVSSYGASGSFGLELGLGGLADIGADFSLHVTNSSTGAWTGMYNSAEKQLRFENASGILEPYALQDASESAVDTDPMITNLGGSKPVNFPLLGDLRFVEARDVLQGTGYSNEIDANSRTQRYKRNPVMSFLTDAELTAGLGVDAIDPNAYAAPGHHIGEITQLGTDGRRYVFGLAAYNHFQEETTFATGKRLNGDAGVTAGDDYGGLISYTGVNLNDLISVNNDYGIDNYYSSSTTPAYAHAYMLTSVLSDDYVDSDDEKGPTDDDLGSYVKFGYEKVADYKWRTPMEENAAYRNEGMKSDLTDDKASFVYGEKDLWYVDTIETKNYIAVFTLEDRNDGAGASDRHGGENNLKRMKLIRKISLYSKRDVEDGGTLTPLQEVHFDYDYSLCEGYPQNFNPADGTGKLTLKKIWFTYQGSGKMMRSPYTFHYDGENPDYNLKAVDRWGNYKPTSYGQEDVLEDIMTNADFPYTTKDREDAAENASAWSLTGIDLPSGGHIEIDYESDDYAYVQHLPAMEMYQVVGIDGTSGNSDLTDYELASVSDGLNKNRAIFFKMKPGHTNPEDYFQKDQFLYFRCLTEFRENEDEDSPAKYDYVSGYGYVGEVSRTVIDGDTLGVISFVGERLKDDGASEYNPISKFAIQFGRLHLSRYIYDTGVGDPTAEGSEQNLTSFANSVVGAFSSLQELFTGPNQAIWDKARGRRIVLNKSFIRLLDPTHRKMGGGHRVKEIRMYDNWNQMTGDAGAGFYYGQHYDYTLEDGTSSGVASYEPQIGGDENPWHRPIPYQDKIRWGTDNKLYQEEPLMESQFPSPTVGYSRVTITNIARDKVTRTATGKVVKEFYTAKDFPTIIKASNVDVLTSNSFLPIGPKYQYLTASQGFTIELNDMHGKPRRESVYPEGLDAEALSTVEYFYQMEQLNLDGVTNHKLTNNVKTVAPNGTQSTAEIGVRYEAVADFRESRTTSTGGSLDLNTNSFLFGFIPIVIPIIWPSIDVSDNQFRSATMNKVVNRFGVLHKIEANQDGSKVETENLAYDAETGQVLATQTTTNFNDKVYSMTYPAYWHYDQMGQAYRNIGYTTGVVDFNNAGFAQVASASSYFVEGDEVAVKVGSSAEIGWVTEVSPSGITVVDKEGAPFTTQDVILKVIRSGRKNKQAVSMASLTSLGNPLAGLVSNVYPKVLNAGAVEFGQDWDTYCDCFSGGTATVNPYVLGTEGNWRPVKSFTHLSGRTQSDYDNNTDIRRDGVFTSYTPYYKLTAGKWGVNPANWTYVSEVTSFSPNGMTLETRDALGRYSSSLFGFNNTLTTAVAANARQTQIAALHFEDFDPENCMDQHIRFDDEVDIDNAEAHTGYRSIEVGSSTPAVITIGLPECPEAPCDMEILPAGTTPGLYQIANGQAPYTLVTDVVSGSVDAVLNGKLILLDGDTENYYEITITVTDANGCVDTITLVNND